MADTTAPRRRTAAKTTPAKKAPAKKAAAEVDGNRATRRAAKKAPAKASTATKKAAAAKAATGRTTGELTFHGRKVTVIRPSSEQLAVWQVYLDRLQGTGGQTKPDARTMVKLLGRVVSLTQSLLVNDADKVWVEDQLLEGSLKLSDAVGLVQRTVDTLTPAGASAGEKPASTSRARRS